MTPEKGLENLRVTISSNGTFGDFQVKELVIHPEESTKSSTTTGIKGLDILSINVFGLHVCSGSCSLLFLSLILLFFVWLFSLQHFFFYHIFLLCPIPQLFSQVSSKVLHFIESVIIQLTAREISQPIEK